MSERLDLKWDEFHLNVSKVIKTLQNEDYLNDVTLVSDDNQHFCGNKLVLSACSEFFQDIFRQNKHQNILLCLVGISSKYLSIALDYVYNGEVQILQEELNPFLGVAQKLKLKGLLSLNEAVDSNQRVESRNSPPQEDEMIILGMDDEFTNNCKLDMSVFEEPPTVQSKDVSPKSKVKQNVKKLDDENQVKKKQQFVKIKLTEEEYENLDEKISELIRQDKEYKLHCTLCGKVTSYEKAGNLRNHMETHFDGLSFSCNMCPATSKTRNGLSCHKSAYHNKRNLLHFPDWTAST